uniref:non-specific serine/threonine protein kinase n=1 Tax=Scleropages formosus TaxID=113540 RepID=A0A8C9U2D5_SCLFO
MKYWIMNYCLKSMSCVIGHLEELFVQGELLGKGGNGCIFAGFRKTDGLPVAIKYVLKSRANVVMDADGPLPLEVALMKRVNAAPACPYILQLIDWFDLPTEYALVLERPHPCQDLSGFCKAQGGVLSEELAHYVLLQVVVALWHCQDRGVVHRDIKPSNLLIKTDTLQVKLIDFSCGKLLKDSPFEDFAGSLSYLPPEWFHDMKYLAGPATVWSLGVTLFQLVCGCWPFQRRKKTVHGRFKFPHWVSADCKRLIRWCLTPSVVYRPTLEKIALHPWFRGTQETGEKDHCKTQQDLEEHSATHKRSCWRCPWQSSWHSAHWWSTLSAQSK